MFPFQGLCYGGEIAVGLLNLVVFEVYSSIPAGWVWKYTYVHFPKLTTIFLLKTPCWEWEMESGSLFSKGVLALGNSTNPNNVLFQGKYATFACSMYISKKSPTGPTERTPKPEYLTIALVSYFSRGPLGFGPI